MSKNPPEISAADGTASSLRRSPRFNTEETNAKKNKKEADRREKKTAEKKNSIGMACSRKVSMKKLLTSQPWNNEDDHKIKTATKEKKNSVNPVGRPRKNKEGDDQEKTTAKKKNPVGRPCKKKKGSKADADAADVKAEMEQGEGERVVTRVMEIGQVWAFPNADASGGGFPRNYARIDRIIPIPPLVEVTPLISQSILDEEKQFAEHGIAYACGVFKASESSAVKDMALFTHEAKFEVEGEGGDLYKIFPRKGEIWAVYWNSNSEYKLVEALSDFSERDGVNVYALAKVEGMDGVYQRQLLQGFYMIRCFSRGFMPMFSHRVLAKTLEEGAAMRWKVAFH